MGKYSNHPLAGARDLDSAINIFWNFYKKNFIGLYIISIIFTLPITIISSGIVLPPPTSTEDVGAILTAFKSQLIPYLELIVLSIVSTIILQAFILMKPSDGKLSLIELIKKTITVLFPYLFTILLLFIPGMFLIAAGFFLFYFPGLFALLYVVTIFLFALPVLLIEDMSPVYAVSRSVKLTNKNLLPNIGWVAVIAILAIIFSIVTSVLTLLPFTGSLINSITDPAATREVANNPYYYVLASLASALITPVFPILSYILYFKNSDIDEIATPHQEENRVRVEDLYPKMPDDNGIK
jgi:hypothetical protein